MSEAQLSDAQIERVITILRTSGRILYSTQYPSLEWRELIGWCEVEVRFIYSFGSDDVMDEIVTPVGESALRAAIVVRGREALALLNAAQGA